MCKRFPVLSTTCVFFSNESKKKGKTDYSGALFTGGTVHAWVLFMHDAVHYYYSLTWM